MSARWKVGVRWSPALPSCAMAIMTAIGGAAMDGAATVGAALADEAGARSERLARARAELKEAAPPHLSQRIVGGVAAAVGEMPWQAAIVERREKPGQAPSIYCGATFVRPTILLTAAHCIEDGMLANKQAFEVLNGDASLAGSRMRRYEITDVIGHPRYDRVSTDYDFALLRVSQAYNGPLIDLLSPAENQALTAGSAVQVSGWGVTASGDASRTLQKVELRLVSRSACNAPRAYNGKITGRMLCAGFVRGGKDACQGDSGGPMTAKTPAGATRLVGVVSWGEGCARPSKYGVYGRIFAVRDWIQSSIALLESEGKPQLAAAAATTAATAAPAVADAKVAPGKPASLGEIKSQAVIMAKPRKADERITDRVRCGATFIRNDILVTAAHCVEGLLYGNKGRFIVLNGGGAADLNDPKMRAFEITDVVPHPRYDSGTVDYDFAIVRVSPGYKGEMIGLVSASEGADIRPGLVARVSGWGLNEKNEVPSVLQTGDLGIIDTAICNGKSSYDGRITDRMLCAGYRDGLKGSCQGDSGGPLMTVLADGKARLIGVVSWGQGCGKRDNYGVYSRLSSVRDWIDRVVETLDKTPKAGAGTRARTNR